MNITTFLSFLPQEEHTKAMTWMKASLPQFPIHLSPDHMPQLYHGTLDINVILTLLLTLY